MYPCVLTKTGLVKFLYFLASLTEHSFHFGIFTQSEVFFHFSFSHGHVWFDTDSMGDQLRSHSDRTLTDRKGERT